MADTLKVWRTRKNITQAELADYLGVCTYTISMWENGTQEPRLSVARKIADYIGCSLDDIIFLRKTSK